MDFFILIIIGVAVYNLIKSQKKVSQGKKPAVQARPAQPVKGTETVLSEPRAESVEESRRRAQQIFGFDPAPAPKTEVPKAPAAPRVAPTEHPVEGVAKPHVAVSMDSRLHAPVQPRIGKDHVHPAQTGSVRMEYVPTGGSLAREAAAQGEIEGCEELQNIRLVRVERPASVEQARIDPRNVVQGIVWSQVLGKRGGRRAM